MKKRVDKAKTKRILKRADLVLKEQQGVSMLPSSEADVVKLVHELDMQTDSVVCADIKIKDIDNNYRTLFMNSPDAYLVVVGDVFTDCNFAAEAMLGGDRSRIIGQPPENLSPEFQPDGSKSSDAAKKMVDIANRSGTNRFEWVHRRFDGTDILVDVTAAQMNLEGKKSLLITWRDITERRKLEIAFQENEKRFKGAFQFSPIGMALVSANGRFLRINSKLCEILGYSEEELLSKTFQELTYSEDLEADLSFVERMLAQEISTYHMEKRYVHKSGRLVWAQLNVSLVTDSSGKPGYFISQIEDITTKKEAEIKAQEYSKTLAFLAHFASSKTGEDFFYALAEYIASTLDAVYVCIDRLEGDGLNARTLAVWHDGKFEDNVVYALKDTPCGEVVGKAVCCFPASVTKLFPSDYVLVGLNAESYVGVTLWSHTGKPIGLIAVIWRTPLANPSMAEELLKLVAVRAAGEMERLETARALQVSETLHRSILLGSPDDITIADMEGRIFAVSPAGLRMFGYDDQNEIIGRSILEFVIPEEHERILSNIMYMYQSGSSTIGEYHGVRKDKTVFHFEVNSDFIRDENGDPLNILIIARDISERKKTQFELLKSVERFEQTVALSVEMVWEIDPDGLFTYVSPLSKEIYGYAQEEMVGKMHFFDLVPKTSVEELTRFAFEGIRRKSKFYNVLTTIVRKDGVERLVITNGAPIQDNNGEIIGYRGINADVTEQKLAEEALTKLNEELEIRVIERTKLLMLANKDLEDFAHTVSHDLRAPLRHINGFIDLLLEELTPKATEDEAKYIQYIIKGAREMDQLIDALLSFSRLSLSNLKKGKIDMTRLVNDVISFYESDLAHRRVIINVGKLPEIKGDQKLLKQVWFNLIANAIKYSSKKEEALIDIGGYEVADGIEYFVKDNGVGFDSRYSKKLFGVFKRLHKQSDFEGIGIGLANVNRIVTRHGGHCRAIGEVNIGATFYFTLPK